jgi:hypothetical protein
MAKRKSQSTVPKRPVTTSVSTTPDGGAYSGSRKELRAAAVQQRRRQNRLWLGAGILLAVVVLAIVVMNLSSRPSVAGVQTFPTQGNLHVDLGSNSPVAYNSTPPTSGPHYPNVAAWRAFSEPQRYELLLHNLEDGGVVVYYQCEDGCPELVNELTEILQPFWNAGRHVVLAPNDPSFVIAGSQPLHQDMGARIALTAWQNLLTMDEVDPEIIRTFIERYEGTDNHRPS